MLKRHKAAASAVVIVLICVSGLIIVLIVKLKKDSVVPEPPKSEIMTPPPLDPSVQTLFSESPVNPEDASSKQGIATLAKLSKPEREKLYAKHAVQDSRVNQLEALISNEPDPAEEQSRILEAKRLEEEAKRLEEDAIRREDARRREDAIGREEAIRREDARRKERNPDEGNGHKGDQSHVKNQDSRSILSEEEERDRIAQEQLRQMDEDYMRRVREERQREKDEQDRIGAAVDAEYLRSLNEQREREKQENEIKAEADRQYMQRVREEREREKQDRERLGREADELHRKTVKENEARQKVANNKNNNSSQQPKKEEETLDVDALYIAARQEERRKQEEEKRRIGRAAEEKYFQEKEEERKKKEEKDKARLQAHEESIRQQKIQRITETFERMRNLETTKKRFELYDVKLKKIEDERLESIRKSPTDHSAMKLFDTRVAELRIEFKDILPKRPPFDDPKRIAFLKDLKSLFDECKGNAWNVSESKLSSLVPTYNDGVAEDYLKPELPSLRNFYQECSNVVIIQKYLTTGSVRVEYRELYKLLIQSLADPKLPADIRSRIDAAVKSFSAEFQPLLTHLQANPNTVHLNQLPKDLQTLLSDAGCIEILKCPSALLPRVSVLFEEASLQRRMNKFLLGDHSAVVENEIVRALDMANILGITDSLALEVLLPLVF